MKLLKTILILCIPILSSTVLLAQEKSKKSKYESLSQRNINTDQNVLDLLMEAESLIASDPVKALDLVEQALATSITHKSSFNEAKCYIFLGKINESQGELELAIQNYTEASNRLKRKYRVTSDFQEILEGIGRVNYQLEKYEESKSTFQQLLNTELGDEKRLEIELKLAEVEVSMGDAPQALDRVSELEPKASYKQSKSLKSKGRTIKARAYVQQENFAAAEESLAVPDEDQDMIIDAEESSDATFFEDEEKEELLNIYQQQNRLEEELELREEIATKKANESQPLEATKQRQAISKVLVEQGRTIDALGQLESAAALAVSSSSFEEQASVQLALAQVYEEEGMTKKALRAYAEHSVALKSHLEDQQANRNLRDILLNKQQEIQALTKDLALDESSYLLDERTTELQAEQLQSQKLLIYGLILLLVVVCTASIYIYRHALKTKRVGQLLALKSLRSQMNPHFIFNALNSVNQFIALNDERAANKFLAEFSKLMRMVLDNSQREFITMREEQEMITLYLKLEHYRFRDQFDYEFVVDKSIDLEEIEIPPMLIQPYIENAIWHGLRYKEDKGQLQVRMEKNGSGIKISIEDDGIGRIESGKIKTSNQKKKSSVGLKNTQERVLIINELYKTNYSIEIFDSQSFTSGTKVEILSPISHE